VSVADFVLYLPPPIELVIVVGVVFAGGFLRGFTGFGAALIIVPVLTIIYTPQVAVVMHLLMEIPGVIQLLPSAIQKCEKKSILPLLVAVLAGVPIGALLLSTIDEQILHFTISVFVLIAVFLLASNWQYKGIISWKIMAGSGFLGGFIQGVVGMGGPPIVTILMSRQDSVTVSRANIIVAMSTMILIALPNQWANGLVTIKVLILGCTAGPIYLLATYAGSKFFIAGGERFFRLVALIMLGAIAILMLVTSIRP
jgi:uncharacterized membrane protein YfcA